MPNKERRGKWQPFDALEGYQRSLRQVEYERKKIPKPVLSEDALEELNDLIIYALESQKEVVVDYYQDGYRHFCEGFIKDINPIEGRIKIDNKVIKLNYLLKITIVD